MKLKSAFPSLIIACSLFSLASLTSVQAASGTQTSIDGYCQEWSKKLRTVKYKGCKQLNLQASEQKSFENRLLTYKEFLPLSPEENTQQPPLPKGKILFIGGIHGDEYSAISITYLWMQAMQKNRKSTQHHWLFLPIVNPDGLFRSDPATRINARGVDLNRNFPSPDWDELALDYWQRYYHKNKRRYPGPKAASEPETRWLVDVIARFRPDAIISVHAPYGLVDYDGPEYAQPKNIGGLTYRELGTFPGSLGRYAGEYLRTPVLTLELKSAGSMPKEKDIIKMWQDIEQWSIEKVRRQENDF